MKLRSEITLSELYASPSRNGIYKSAEFHGSGFKIVNMGELFGYDFISSQEMKRVQLTDKELENFSLQNGDLLFGRRSLVEAGAGKCSIVFGIEEPLTFESSIIRVRLNNKMANPRFYFYYFKSPQGRGSIYSIVTGTNVKGIRGTELGKLKVLYLPITAQDTIVKILSVYDTLIENNLRRIQLLEQSAQLLYREWFLYLRFPGHEHVRIIDGVPEGWEKKSLGGIIEIKKGKNITKETASNGKVPVVAGGLNPAYFHNKPNAACPVITISASGANAGYVNIYHEDIWASDCSYISEKSTEDIYYYYSLLKSKQKEIFGLQKGAAQPHVYPKDLMRLSVLSPPDKILGHFSDNTSPVFLMIKNLITQNKSLIQARDILLPRLMNGEIAV